MCTGRMNNNVSSSYKSNLFSRTPIAKPTATSSTTTGSTTGSTSGSSSNVNLPNTGVVTPLSPSSTGGSTGGQNSSESSQIIPQIPVKPGFSFKINPENYPYQNGVNPMG